MIKKTEEPYVVIEVRGGVVLNVCANRPVQYVVVDHDDLDHEFSFPRIQEAFSHELAKVQLTDKAIENRNKKLFNSLWRGE